MTVALATALLGAGLGAFDGTAVEVRTGGRAETSALAFSAGGGETRALAAVDVLPRLGLFLDHERTLRLELAYTPQLRLSQALSYAGSDAAVAHAGSARAEWDLHPLWSASGTARSSVRLLDLVASPGHELARLMELRAAPAALRVAEEGATLGLEGRPTRRVTVAGAFAAESSGGLGPAGRVAMPPMRELRVAGSVARDFTRKDVLRLEASAAAAAFTARGASLATLGASWRREAARTVRLRLAAAASEARADGVPARLVPGGEVAVEVTPALLGRPLRAALAARAGPAFDRFEAGVQERLGLDASATWEVAPRWSVGALGATGRVRERGGYSASRADVRTDWRAARRLTVYAHVWGERHDDPRLATGATATYLGSGIGIELAPLSR